MNLGLPLSYIIAGMLMITITIVGYNVMYSSNELTFHEIQKLKSSSVIEIIEHDFPKIGYNRENRLDSAIYRAGDNYIEFYSNLDNSSDDSFELIRWEFTTDSIPNTENPNDYVLERSVDGVKTRISAGITNFTIRYYSSLGGTTPTVTPLTAVSNKATIDGIRQIEIILETESTSSLNYRSSNADNYIKTSWTKRYSPANLANN